MSKIMLVNVTHVEESRVAIVEDGVLASYEIETLNRTHIKGNIYNAVVELVHPSLEAAFLRVGPELKGFLPLDEVNFRLLPSRGERGRGGRIGQHLHGDQKLMVQVVREPFAGKPPTVSTYFSLPGRYLVLMPGVDAAGVSRKIADASQRERLKTIVEELRPPEGFGLIVRTAGVGQTKVELQRDLRYLLRLWESIQRASQATDFPGLVYREQDLVIRTIRDYFTPEVGEVWIDSQETYERALEFVRDVMPTKASALRLYTGQRPLFNKFNLEEQIESIYKRRVPLKSGGEIVVDGTEALTAIDVNSARSQRQGDAEENNTQTNLEAAAEIARQLRLRDLGGLVVIDFIDMDSKRNNKRVEKAMRDAMRGDKAKYDITPISKLGLMEITRQRIKGEKIGASYATCPTCEGFGLVKNVEAAALAALRKLQTRCARGDAGRVRMSVPPEVAVWILNHKRADLGRVEQQHGLRIEVEPNPGLLRHQSEFESFPRKAAEEPAAIERVPQGAPSEARAAEEAVAEVAGEVPPVPAATPAAADAATDVGGGPGRRRRRRRRRHSRAGVLAGGETVPTRPGGPGEGVGGWAAPSASGPVGSPEEPTGNGATASAPPEASAEDPTAERPEETGMRRRRRRRRRRRPGQAVGLGQPGGAGEGQAEGPPQYRVDDGTVPRGVRANELMPAAASGSRAPHKTAPGRRPRERWRTEG
jgi:ribonuclease E